MLNRKPLMVAALGATVAVATLSTQAYANDDALLGALVGAGIGAGIRNFSHFAQTLSAPPGRMGFTMPKEG